MPPSRLKDQSILNTTTLWRFRRSCCAVNLSRFGEKVLSGRAHQSYSGAGFCYEGSLESAEQAQVRQQTAKQAESRVH